VAYQNLSESVFFQVIPSEKGFEDILSLSFVDVKKYRLDKTLINLI